MHMKKQRTIVLFCFACGLACLTTRAGDIEPPSTLANTIAVDTAAYNNSQHQQAPTLTDSQIVQQPKETSWELGGRVWGLEENRIIHQDCTFKIRSIDFLVRESPTII